jgi:hypothetical protein
MSVEADVKGITKERCERRDGGLLKTDMLAFEQFRPGDLLACLKVLADQFLIRLHGDDGAFQLLP